MSLRCRNAVAIAVLVLAAACQKQPPAATTPTDPFTAIEVGRLSLTALSGSNVLLLTAGGLVVGDSGNPLLSLEPRRNELLQVANSVLDTALRRDGREVTWMGLEEQRRIARRNPTLGIDPDRLSTVELFSAQAERVPDPLFGRLRTLAAMAGARYALAPAAVKIGGTPEAMTASIVIVLVDARGGGVLFRARASGGPAPTAEQALARAAGVVIASPLQ